MFTNNDVVAFIIVPLIGNLFLIYVFFEFMGKVERNTYKHKFAYVISYIAFSIIASSIPLLGVPILSGMSIIVGNMLIGHYLYNNTKLYLLYYFIYSICLLFCDLLINIVNPILVTELGIYFSSTQSYLMFSVLTLRLLEYIYSKLFTLLINKRSAVNVTAKQCIRTLIVPIFSIVYIFTLIMYLQIYIGLEEMSLFMVNVILILILNVYMTYIIDSISKNNILQNEINLYHQQTKLQYQYYDNLEMKYQESRKLIHDIRNHLHTIEDLYNMNDLQAGTKYTQDIHQMLNELNQKYYTSNKVLNIILNDKFQKIKNTHIDLDYRIGNIDLGFIRDIDITTVFANLLDNAIDAAMVVKNNSYIKIDVDKFNEFIVINIENSTNDIPVKKGERFKSTKKNHQGLGLDNTIRAIKGYGGTMVVDYCENKFKVNIVIPT